MMRALDPSAKMQSSAVTHRRVDPNSSECAPAAFVAAIPPTVQNSPLDGSTGNLKPCLAAAELTADRRAPGPTPMRRAAASTGPIVVIVLKSTMTPAPIAPPAMLVPEPRGMSDRDRSRAHRTSATTSSECRGTATALGMPCPDSRRLGVHRPRLHVLSELALKTLRTRERRIGFHRQSPRALTLGGFSE